MFFSSQHIFLAKNLRFIKRIKYISNSYEKTSFLENNVEK